MLEYLRWLFGSFDGYEIHSALASVSSLVHGSSLLFWGALIGILRFTVPEYAVGIAYLLNRRAFESPPLRKYGSAPPLISVIIAGRNPGMSLVACIRSVLECDYRNLEIIFADDCSTDNTVALARAFERGGRVRVFANANHSGKPANLNLALMFTRGEFIFVLDSDSQVYADTIHKMLAYFEDPRVGAVAAGIYPRNKTASLLTRFQRIEYMLTYTLTQLWRDKMNIIAIVPGMGSMFRATALKGIGGYDMGLGDDTDITLRLRKAGWRLKMALRGRISTDVPVTLGHLLRQRSRWTRNMVKMRVRKHRDMGTGRFGLTNAFIFYDNLINRAIHPVLSLGLILYANLYLGKDDAIVMGSLYSVLMVLLFIKVLIVSDMTGEPPLSQFWLVPLYVFYHIPLLLNQAVQVTRELLYIKTWHPYVPRRIWRQIPHH
jgi:cellulose synthase/poly-beta-1,6-N-acetylglucosamine synthase-like glycosyltransferase